MGIFKQALQKYSVDKWIYINLDKRADRNLEILGVLQELGVPAENIIRFPAIEEANGALGCAKSHRAVLEMIEASDWKSVAILEDDFMLQSSVTKEVFWSSLYEAPEHDVFLLCVGKYGRKTANLDSKYVRVLYSQTSSGYILRKRETVQSLRLAATKAIESLSRPNTPSHGGAFAFDQVWKGVQQKSQWISTRLPLGKQRSGFSDIEKRQVNYDA